MGSECYGNTTAYLVLLNMIQVLRTVIIDELRKKSCSKHKEAKARLIPLQKSKAEFRVGRALCTLFKMLAFPLGGLWEGGREKGVGWGGEGGCGAFTCGSSNCNNLSQPALASYELCNRAQRTWLFPLSLFLCLFTKLTASDWLPLCPLVYCHFISRLHVHIQSDCA